MKNNKTRNNIFIGEINKRGIDAVLMDSIRLYEKSSIENNSLGIALSKSAYQKKIRQAQEMRLDISKYPTELNYLGYLIR
jgi:hypothetical protein